MLDFQEWRKMRDVVRDAKASVILLQRYNFRYVEPILIGL